ncbi:hypothetical protein KC19_VG134900 [Ceratodon purpureus]|uniref:Uncharacterized protein n=1 Tax=Ceratodon purpureus TaxID=3225 RepID=A0A8T0HQU8_CERPU|nr:hypothetical protein KC19_VG134900 [Ceratodon purpureus]
MAGSMSHYCTRHVALKIMYIGSSYQGFASRATSPNKVEVQILPDWQSSLLALMRLYSCLLLFLLSLGFTFSV